MAHHRTQVLVRRKFVSQWPEVLSGWKNISGFLGVSIKTAMRYRKTHGLPVTTNPHPMALRKELEVWVQGRRGGERMT